MSLCVGPMVGDMIGRFEFGHNCGICGQHIDADGRIKLSHRYVVGVVVAAPRMSYTSKATGRAVYRQQVQEAPANKELFLWFCANPKMNGWLISASFDIAKDCGSCVGFTSWHNVVHTLQLRFAWFARQCVPYRMQVQR